MSHQLLPSTTPKQENETVTNSEHGRQQSVKKEKGVSFSNDINFTQLS